MTTRRPPGDYTRVIIPPDGLAGREPVFHRVVHVGRSGDALYEMLVRLGCRRTGQRRISFAGAYLPRVHAEAFARPCRRCFQ